MIELLKFWSYFRKDIKFIRHLATGLSLAVLVSLIGLFLGPVFASSSIASTTSKFSNFELRQVLTEIPVTSSNPCPPVQLQNGSSTPLTTCSVDGKTLFGLGPVEVNSSTITSAKMTTIQDMPSIEINFNDAGTKYIGDVTTRISRLPSPQNELAVVINARVQIAPRVYEPITSGKLQVSFGAGATAIKDAQNFLSAIFLNNIPGTKCPKMGVSAKSGTLDVKCQKIASRLLWEVAPIVTRSPMTAEGLLTIDCSNTQNLMVRILDPITGSTKAGLLLPYDLFAGTSSEIQFFACNPGPFNLYSTAVRLRFIREQFSPDFSKTVYGGIRQADGSLHVGYMLTSNKSYVDVTAMTTSSSFSSTAPRDTGAVFDPESGDFYYLRNGLSVHRFNTKTRKDTVVGNLPGSSWQSWGITVWKGVVAVGESLLSPDSKYAAQQYGDNRGGWNVGIVKVIGSIFNNIDNPGLVTYLKDPFITNTKLGGEHVDIDLQGWVDSTHLSVSTSNRFGFFKIPINLSSDALDANMVNLLPESGGTDENFLTSPDGKQIAWKHMRSSIQDLYIMSLKPGSQPKKIFGSFQGFLVAWK